jgi:predicted O-methyltransferase YrrM
MTKIKDKKEMEDLGELEKLEEFKSDKFVTFDAVYDPPTEEEIKEFILDSGSDHVPTFGGKFEGGIQAQQRAEEFAPCLRAILHSGKAIESYLEIGSAAGGSAFLINHFLKPKKIVLVDNNKHPKAHIRPYILRDVPHDEVIGDSHDESVISQVFNMGVSFDCIMIDGDHDNVKSDIESYSGFVKDRGFLIFHDSQIGEPYGTYKAAQDLKEDEGWEVIGEYISEKGPACGTLLLRRVITNENN